jgi:hypothetical protein
MKIVPLLLREANDFVEKHHRHSCRTNNDGGKFAIGLEHDGVLVGVAIVGRTTARLLHEDGAAELTRLCVSPAAPKGANAKLYARAKRIWQLMGGTKLHTYWLAKESGASMRGVGAEPAVVVEGNRQWDTPSRPREERDIYEEPKVRWTETLPEIPA